MNRGIDEPRPCPEVSPAGCWGTCWKSWLRRSSSQFLEKTDPQAAEAAYREAIEPMAHVFHLLGPESELAGDYRGKLTRVL